MKFTLSEEEVKNATLNAVKQLEKELILRLAAGGIDIDSFDPDTFIFNSDSGIHSGIEDILLKIKNLKEKL